MKYVQVPRELSSRDIRTSEACFSPGRYVRFVPPAQSCASHYAPLDQLVVVREEFANVSKADTYQYAEIGDIDVATGGVTFREMKGYSLPSNRPAKAESGDVLISTVRTYRKGIGLVTASGNNLVTTPAILNFKEVTNFAPNLTLPYIYSFLRSDFFVEQVWSLLHRGVYPRMDSGALDKILIPIPHDKAVSDYVTALILAVVDKEDAIRRRHTAIVEAIGAELRGNDKEKFQFEFPSIEQIRRAARMDAGFWSPNLREQIHRLRQYRLGAWDSIYAAGFTTRRGPNLAVSVSGPARYSDMPFGSALPMATPGDISDYMTIPRFRFYGNPRRVDTVRHGEILFAGKGVREVSIGHTWVNLGHDPFVTNFDSFLIHSADRTRAIFLACFMSYLKSVGVFAKLSDTSNGGSFVQSHFRALPIPKFEDEFQAKVARLYHNPVKCPASALTLSNFVSWHKKWNEGLGIWELDHEMKILQATLAETQEEIIKGRPPRLPF